MDKFSQKKAALAFQGDPNLPTVRKVFILNLVFGRSFKIATKHREII